MFKKLKGKVESSILYSRIEAEMSRVTHPVKNKVKKEIAYAKEHPVKATFKAAATICTVYRGGHLMLNIYDITTIPYQNMKDVIKYRTEQGTLRESDCKYLYYLIDEIKYGGGKLLVEDSVKFITCLLTLGLINKTDADKAIEAAKKR